jgi:hypothetical protein
VNFGPSCLLFDKPTGYSATMVGFPYDDLETWRTVYPVEIFQAQLKKVTDGWMEGLKVLEKLQSSISDGERAEFNSLFSIARAVYLHFRSTWLQGEFVRTRNRGALAEAKPIVSEELEIARELQEIIRSDSRIGFEASNHYFYIINDLVEKVLNCEYLLQHI